jgi:hypothetical protein
MMRDRVVVCPGRCSVRVSGDDAGARDEVLAALVSCAELADSRAALMRAVEELGGGPGSDRRA